MHYLVPKYNAENIKYFVTLLTEKEKEKEHFSWHFIMRKLWWLATANWKTNWHLRLNIITVYCTYMIFHCTRLAVALSIIHMLSGSKIKKLFLFGCLVLIISVFVLYFHPQPTQAFFILSLCSLSSAICRPSDNLGGGVPPAPPRDEFRTRSGSI